ncbi:Aminomethyltransferase, mitochondrial [Nakaseomyces bracarensis]|uniref:Aminomethyltransferase n=1 Tax=Nakaseomyces bracarensis TaxID=273131 RepID=A0ABR4NMI6_9SACH
MSSTVFKRLNSTSALKKTALYDLHVSLGATMVPFAGYSMPVLYKGQSHIESHLWTRNNAGLFDVSHMLQSRLTGPYATKLLHNVTPTDFVNLPTGTGSLTVLLNESGGVVDDTIVTKESDTQYYIVTNAGCIDRDTEFITNEVSKLGKDCQWEVIPDRALLALQGPKAQQVLQGLVVKNDNLNELYFGQRREFTLDDSVGTKIGVARGGYTGEDGFEISIENPKATEFAEKLLDNGITKPIGLAARDSLRLEAGMCLYGHELNESITPVEAGLSWVISKSRRDIETVDDRFNGYGKIIDQLKNKTHEFIRIAFKYKEKGPAARHGAKIFLEDGETEVGEVTSGSAAPSLNNINIGQGYINRKFNKKGKTVMVQVRKRLYPVELVKMPLVPTHYHR